MRRILSAVAALAIWLAAPAAFALQLPGPLVDVAWVAANLDKLRILEIRDERESFAVAPEYATDRRTGKPVLARFGGHLPGSAWVDFSKVRVDRVIGGQKVRYMGPEKADFEQLARGWGVNRGDAIVIVSLGESIADLNEAARVYWQFKYFGEDNVAIMNGGTLAWLSARAPASTAVEAPKPGDWSASAERQEIVATSEETAAASERGERQLVDARPIAQHHGLSKSGAVTQFGHIAGSKLAAQELLSKPVGGAAHYLDVASYRALLERMGISETQPTITYCNTGHQATGFWFVISELLGNKQAKLYDGSLHQWTQYASNPMATRLTQ